MAMEYKFFADVFVVFSKKGGHAACVVGIAILSWVILWLCFRRNKNSRDCGVPPPSWPVVGMLPYIFAHLHEIYEWSSQVLIDYGGTIDFKPPWMANMFSLVTIDPKNIEYIVKTKFANFPRGAYFRSIGNDLLGNGILNVDGQEWVEARKMMSSIFHSKAYKNHLIHTLDELSKCRLMPAAEAACKRSSVVDLQYLLVRFTFENMCVVGFGFGIDFNFEEVDGIAKAFDEALEASLHRFLVPSFLWKAMRLLGLGKEGKLKASLQVIQDFFHRLISHRRKELLAGGFQVRQDLLSKLMQMEQYCDKAVQDMCISFVLAGRDTTSVALSWFFWLIIQHPVVEHNILLEIKKIMERRSDEHKHELMEFRVEEVKEMHYLHAALSESLRLYPPLPINFKEVREEEMLPDGRLLKKGASLMFSIYGMGRAENIWGNDCREFKPERWLREGLYVEENNASKYPVFNTGPRVCLGKDFAYLQMKWVAALLIYRYRMESVKDAVVEPKLGINLFMKNGLLVTLHRRHLDTTVSPPQGFPC